MLLTHRYSKEGLGDGLALGKRLRLGDGVGEGLGLRDELGQSLVDSMYVQLRVASSAQ